jgi:HEPN domain-containing protein
MQQVQTYRERGRAYLAKAHQEFQAGDLEQASEKGWGAAALMVKAVAQQRGEPHYAHPFLSRFVDDLAVEVGDETLSGLFDSAEALHVNFYEHRINPRGVERRIRAVEHFVGKMERILGPEH